MPLSKLRALTGVALLASAAALMQAAPASAAARPGPVSQTAASFTPWLLSSTANQNVIQLAQCGPTMYAVGTISHVGQGNSTYTRGNAFSFSATTGAMTAWNPQVNGTVHSIAFSADCSTAYLGGAFGSVHGSSAQNIAAVDTTNGALRTGFAHSANAVVDTLQSAHGLILAGGQFSSINGASRSRLASLDPTTGAPTGYANIAFAGNYTGYTTGVYNSQLSHSGNQLLIQGVFTSISGQTRQQVALLDLGATSVQLNGWNAPEFNTPCAPWELWYAHGGAWSADDSTIYIASAGFGQFNGPRGPGGPPMVTPSGMCDSASAFANQPTAVTHTWINYTGCDSVYSVVADLNNVYVGGHQRWANNPAGCDMAGPGALPRSGIAGYSTTTGLATSWNPGRSRGHGAEGLTLTDAGLWIASDNGSTGTSQSCGGRTNRGGICFLPY